jgi:hypothetical protein
LCVLTGRAKVADISSSSEDASELVLQVSHGDDLSPPPLSTGNKSPGSFTVALSSSSKDDALSDVLEASPVKDLATPDNTGDKSPGTLSSTAEQGNGSVLK